MELRLDHCRISFANGLWTKSSAVEGGTKKYNSEFIIDETTKILAQKKDGSWGPITMEAAQLHVATEAKGGDAKKGKTWLDTFDARQKAYRDGNKRIKGDEVRDGYADRMYVAAKNDKRPTVLTLDKQEVEAEEDSPIYSGCYVDARIRLYPNTKAGQMGIFAELKGVRFRGDADGFGGGGGRASADEFDDASEGADAGEFA